MGIGIIHQSSGLHFVKSKPTTQLTPQEVLATTAENFQAAEARQLQAEERWGLPRVVAWGHGWSWACNPADGVVGPQRVGLVLKTGVVIWHLALDPISWMLDCDHVCC